MAPGFGWRSTWTTNGVRYHRPCYDMRRAVVLPLIEQGSGPDPERLGELDDVHQRNVPLAAFHVANVGPVQAGAVGKLFLSAHTNTDEPRI
jgi:hypothetical protein